MADVLRAFFVLPCMIHNMLECYYYMENHKVLKKNDTKNFTVKNFFYFCRMDNKSEDIQLQSNAEVRFLHERLEELEKKLLRQSDLEQMVEESEQRFKQMLSLTYDGIILYEKNSGNLIEANIRLIHKLKYRRDDVIGKSVTRFVIPSQQEMINKRLTEELPDVYETFVIDSEGQPIEVEICSRSCLYHGRKVKMASICDISYRKQYEKTLRESEEKFRSLAENTNDSIILIDEKEIIYCNPISPSMFGLAEESLVNLTMILTHIHPDDRKTAESYIHSATSGQRCTEYCQFRIVAENQKERWFWSHFFPVASKNHNDTRLVMISSDITEMHEKEEIRKQTEIAVKTAEEKYKVLTSLMPEMVFETDASNLLTFVNLKAIETFEYGSSFYVSNLRFVELICKEDQQRCIEYFQKIISGEICSPEEEYMAITKTGRKFPVTLYITKTYENNEYSGLNIIMFDKTNQKTAEETALNYRENMSFLSKSALNFLTFSSDDDIFIFVGKSLSKFTSKSIVVVFSYEQSTDISNIRYISGIYPHINELVNILGKPPEDFDIKLPDKFISKYLTNKTLRRISGGLKSIVTDEKPQEMAEEIENLLGVNHFYSMGMVRESKLYGGLLIATNSETESIDVQTIVTFIYQASIALHRKQIDNELVKAKLAAEESDRLKSAFLANMSHEVRTPLNGILGLAQVMLKSEDLSPTVRNDVNMIVNSGSSLLSLIEDIMDVSKIEAGEMKIKYKAFHLNGLMDQLYSMFMTNPLYLQKNANQQNIELKYDKPDQDTTVMSDPDRLQQVFVNLIGNALKFTQKGIIRFGYFIKNQEITFYVKDSGIGIAKDKTEKIFERFAQVDSTLARKYSGSGLGLAISKGLTTLLNGKIWCESALGRGSDFYFTIPYHRTSMPVETDIPLKKKIKEHDWSHHAILIVEDDTINFKVIEAMLRDTKVKVIHADNGLRAIELVSLNPAIDLVLMDVHLPVMSGLEATEKIMKINPALPIIAQTANAMSDDMEKCLEAGCIDYISKPINMVELIIKISNFLTDQ